MRKGVLILFALLLFFAMKCNVPIDLRTPDSAIDTFIKIANVNNVDEFKMIEDKTQLNLNDEAIKKIFHMVNNSYFTIINRNFDIDDKLGNINVFKVKIVSKENGKVSFYHIGFRIKKDNLWYLYKIEKIKKE